MFRTILSAIRLRGKTSRKVIRLEVKVDGIIEEFKRISEKVKVDLEDMQNLHGRFNKQMTRVDEFLRDGDRNVTNITTGNTVAKAMENLDNVTSEMRTLLEVIDARLDTVNKRQVSFPCWEGPLADVFFVVGARVVRGKDWKWDNQDGNPPGQGTITKGLDSLDRWVQVEWDNGSTYSYRVGAEDRYDIKLEYIMLSTKYYRDSI